MGKKKDKTQPINNIQNLNIEINYEKLAEAIVKAQNKNIDEHIHNKATSKTFAGFIAFFLRGLAIVSLPIMVLLSVLVYRTIDMLLAGETYVSIIAKVIGMITSSFVSFSVGSYAALLWKAAKEIKNEKDKNYIVSVFSGLVSFAALIVALVALVKG